MLPDAKMSVNMGAFCVAVNLMVQEDVAQSRRN
jgi:hypothetical protein